MTDIGPNLFWLDDDEDLFAFESLDVLAANLDIPESGTLTLKVTCARRMPSRKITVWLDHDEILHWHFADHLTGDPDNYRH